MPASNSVSRKASLRTRSNGDNPGEIVESPEKELLAQGHPTADRIMIAAVDLFLQKGFDGASVKDITVAAELTPAALYLYFPSKDAVLSSIAASAFKRLGGDLSKATKASQGSAREALERLTDAFLTFVTTYPRVALLIDREWRRLAPRERQVIARKRSNIVTQVESVVVAGLEGGEFSVPPTGGKAEARIAAVAIVNMAAGLADWYRQEGRLSREEIIQIYRELIERIVGLGPAGGQ